MVIAVASEFGDDFRRFVYYRIENGTVKEREEVAASDGGCDALARQLIGLEIDLLIAGNVAEELELALADAGLHLISGIHGASDPILKQYLAGELDF